MLGLLRDRLGFARRDRQRRPRHGRRLRRARHPRGGGAVDRGRRRPAVHRRRQRRRAGAGDPDRAGGRRPVRPAGRGAAGRGGQGGGGARRFVCACDLWIQARLADESDAGRGRGAVGDRVRAPCRRWPARGWSGSTRPGTIAIGAAPWGLPADAVVAPGSTDAARRAAGAPGARRAPAARRAGHAGRGRLAARSWSSGAGPAARTDDLPTIDARGWSQPGAVAVTDVLRRGRVGPVTGAIGLDIGATKTLGVLVDADGRVLEQVREATEPGADGVVRTAELVVAHLGAATDGAPATSVGLGIPGLVDVERGAVKHAVNLGVDGDWVPLRAELEARLGVPVAVENDVNVATLGAVALSGIRDLVYLSIGTGLAAGLVLDGTLRRGATGAAGEIGHVPIDPHGALCQCGQRGCLETVASGRALAEAWPSGRARHRRRRRCSPRPRPATRGRSRSGTGSPRAWPTPYAPSACRWTRRRSCSAAVSPTSARRWSTPCPTRCARRPPPRRSWPRSTWPPGSGWCPTTSRLRRSGRPCWVVRWSGSRPPRLRRGGRRARGGHDRGTGPRPPVLRARAGHRLVPGGDLRRARRAAPGRHRPVVRRGAGVPPRRVRRPAARPPAVLPGHHRPRADRRPRPAGRPRARTRPDRRADRRRRVRGAAGRGRRRRPPGPRHRQRRPPRLQRARLVARPRPRGSRP